MLYQEDLECWYLFVQACRILVTPLLKIDEAKKGHEMLLKFCRQFQQLYGRDKVTPNMHMHRHILNCILDYGPVYAFCHLKGTMVFWVATKQTTGPLRYN